MPEFNALLGLKRLCGLEASARGRNEVVALYREELGCLSGLTFQEVRPGNRSSPSGQTWRNSTALGACRAVARLYEQSRDVRRVPRSRLPRPFACAGAG